MARTHLALVQTGAAFGMAKDTVGCAVAYMDRYLSIHSVTKRQLQMLALVTLSMASKMHETQPISLVRRRVLSVCLCCLNLARIH